MSEYSQNRIDYLLSDQTYNDFEERRKRLNQKYTKDLIESKQHDQVFLQRIQKEYNEIVVNSQQQKQRDFEFLEQFKKARQDCQKGQQKVMNKLDNLFEVKSQYLFELINDMPIIGKAHKAQLDQQPLQDQIHYYKKQKENEAKKQEEPTKIQVTIPEDQNDNQQSHNQSQFTNIYQQKSQVKDQNSLQTQICPQCLIRPSSNLQQPICSQCLNKQTNSLTYSQQVSYSQLQQQQNTDHFGQQQTFKPTKMQESHNDGNRIDYDNIDYDDEEF